MGYHRHEPFVIFLPDNLIFAREGGTGCMKQMDEAHNEVGGNPISVLEVLMEQVSSYGVIERGNESGALTEVRGLAEKPAAADVPSNKIVLGRDILQPAMMQELEHQGKGAGSEIQLTDAMAKMIGTEPFHAVTFDSARYDCGSKVRFDETTLALALARDDMGAKVRTTALNLLK